MRNKWVAIILIVFGVGIIAFAFRVPLRAAWDNFRKPDVPEAVDYDELTNQTVATNTNTNTNTPRNTNSVVTITLPAEINLKVPFTSQAPHANWDDDHGEFCEEASVLMAGRFFAKQAITSKDDAEAALQRLKARELELFGYHRDTTAAETARLLEDRYEVTGTLLQDPTVDELKRELAAGHLIILPAAGRQLGNPNFRQPGPLYHMLVIKGYTKDGNFITNDPGTRNGADYIYAFDRLMTALHDWNGGEVDTGAKVVIVVAPIAS